MMLCNGFICLEQWYLESFYRDKLQQGVWGKGLLCPLMGPRQSPVGDQVTKFVEAPRIYYSNITYFWLKYTLYMPKSESEVNFSMQLHTSLTHEDPAYLQITCHYVYYLKEMCNSYFCVTPQKSWVNVCLMKILKSTVLKK